ncbi:nuclear transport factor 2 family protein [Streptomyces sp. NBC_01549]|uniref:nuclear transport factor 2 family protein n=1 Tax=Streptomyces sp. NBC_01549 TaxID=2975874 RepID=UPI00224D7F10|nr:nuclear transport factor 2 family protein [Streptomyces sp. NBC_01549]MCX4591810.1 nuclear transport factor 2 family protein [Streptomyces sp. NBC_01549]
MQSVKSVAIGALLDRYLINLDDDKLDDEWAATLFTEDARIEFPMSRHQGINGLAAYHRDALAMFERTQHLNSPTVVDLVDDDRACLRANLVSTHVHRPGTAAEPLFVTGTLVTGEALRTSGGWRLAALDFRVVWMTGSPPRAGEDR